MAGGKLERSEPLKQKIDTGDLTLLCWIDGLKLAPWGEKYNGSSALTNTASREMKKNDFDRLVPVLPSGSIKPVMIPRKNIIIQNGDRVEITVFQAYIWEDTFVATVSTKDEYVGEYSVANNQYVLSKAILDSVQKILLDIKKADPNKAATSTTIIYLEDLNLERSLNKTLVHPRRNSDTLLVDTQIRKKFDSTVTAIKSFGGSVRFRRRPTSLAASGEFGDHRYNAVAKSGSFHLYPCPDNYSHIEAQYYYNGVHRTSRFASYGKSEIALYIKQAVMQGDVDRIHPRMLAKVDESQFWCCILHFATTLQTLKSMKLMNASVGHEWARLGDGVQKQQKRISTIATGLSESQIAIPMNGKWKINSTEYHQYLSKKCFQAALLVTLGESIYVEKGKRDSVKSSVLTENDQLLQMYELFKLQIEGKDQHKIIQRCLGSSIKSCLACGKTEKKVGNLITCGKCQNANYCSQGCLQKDWDNGHSQTCKRIR